MSAGGSCPDDDQTQLQRAIARIALGAIRESGFALAGSGAIREHGLTNRPTEDVDLFTTSQHADHFGAAVHAVLDDLRAGGYEVEPTQQYAHFARLHVTTAGAELDVDMGIDWRADEPVALGVGPVLSLADAVGNKVAAVYSRGEARDYLDVDAIRASGRFTDQQLVAAVAQRDSGFDQAVFAQQLEAARRLEPVQVARYRVSPQELEAVKERFAAWAAELRAQPSV
ncbi:MAG TPA: nucleotidyl transferase AbiEii/AbiGii toxin family protein [Solirubrobacter sp.]|nr:nucleotidyl transferase AbiEii/AbiGii toxin family protein [Solirubrobacter sp.]